jgi:zinc transport system substrate-binding protein
MILKRNSTMQRFLPIVAVLLLLPFPAKTDDGKTGRMPIFVSILPVAYFVERIGGDNVDINVLVGPGQSPETFEPTSKQLVRLSSSRAFFSIGVPFEAAILTRIRNNFHNVEIIEAGAGIALRESNHHETDPHVWLDPELAVIISGNIYVALARLDPDHKTEYEANWSALIKDLTNIDEEIGALLAPLKGKPFYVFHPAYAYLADAYGLVQVSIEEGGSSPGSKHLAALIDKAKEQKVRAIFTQPQHSSSSAKTIADEIGADLVVLDPLSRDYLANMKEIALRIKEALNEK